MVLKVHVSTLVGYQEYGYKIYGIMTVSEVCKNKELQANHEA